MFLKLLSLSLRATPAIAAVAGVAWAAKKLVEYADRLGVNPLETKDVEDNFKTRELFKALSCDMSGKKDDLAAYPFVKQVGDFDNLEVAYFEYCDVLFTFQKYSQQPKFQYSVYVDFDSAKKVSIGDIDLLVQEFIEELGLGEKEKISKVVGLKESFAKYRQRDVEPEVLAKNKPSEDTGSQKVEEKPKTVAKKASVSKTKPKTVAKKEVAKKTESVKKQPVKKKVKP